MSDENYEDFQDDVAFNLQRIVNRAGRGSKAVAGSAGSAAGSKLEQAHHAVQLVRKANPRIDTLVRSKRWRWELDGEGGAGSHDDSTAATDAHTGLNEHGTHADPGAQGAEQIDNGCNGRKERPGGFGEAPMPGVYMTEAQQDSVADLHELWNRNRVVRIR